MTINRAAKRDISLALRLPGRVALDRAGALRISPIVLRPVARARDGSIRVSGCLDPVTFVEPSLVVRDRHVDGVEHEDSVKRIAVRPVLVDDNWVGVEDRDAAPV